MCPLPSIFPVPSFKAKHKEQIDRLIARAHHHRKGMNDDKVTVEHLVLALGENPRWDTGPGEGISPGKLASYACVCSILPYFH